MLGWATPQLAAISGMRQSPEIVLWSLIIDDAQDAEDLSIIISKQYAANGLSGSAAFRMFRLSNYLGDGQGVALVSLIQSAAEESEWVTLYAGGTLCPPPVLELMTFLAGSSFEVPRFLVVVEALDYACASPELRQLVGLGKRVDLTEQRSGQYFVELVDRIGAPPEDVKQLVELHLRVLGTLPAPHRLHSTRSLLRACETVRVVGARTAAKLEYLVGLDPADRAYVIVEQLINEVFP